MFVAEWAEPSVAGRRGLVLTCAAAEVSCYVWLPGESVTVVPCFSVKPGICNRTLTHC